MNFLRMIISFFLRIIATVVSTVVFLSRAIFFLDKVRRYECVVIMPEGGFGHVITGPDAVRRMRSGKKTAFVAVSESGRINPLVATIWPDIDIYIFWTGMCLKIRHRRIRINGFFKTKIFFSKTLAFLIKRIKSAIEIKFLHDMHNELCRAFPVPEEDAEKLSLSHRWVLSYFQLFQKVNSPKLHLPDALNRKILEKLNLCAQGAKKLCCLYIRQKGKDCKESTTLTRVGSGVREYLPAVDLLSKKGYLVLLTGDILVGDRNLIKDNDNILYGEKINMDKPLFDLFAALESDIFIGESGGGTWLSGINGIPRLIINGFPFSYGMPHALIWYKFLKKKEGAYVDPRVIFSQYLYAYDFEGMALVSSNAQEILGAVEEFFGWLENRIKIPPQRYPPASWLKYSGATLSSKWLAIQNNETAHCYR